MNTETVLGVIEVLVFGLMFLATVVNTILIFLLFQNKKSENERLANIEHYLKELSEEVETQVSPDSSEMKMFHSVDGKYHASSLPELIKMMMQDPENGIPQGADPSDPKVIQEFLNSINSEPQFDEEYDDDDDDDPADRWKNKG